MRFNVYGNNRTSYTLSRYISLGKPYALQQTNYDQIERRSRQKTDLAPKSFLILGSSSIIYTMSCCAESKHDKRVGKPRY
jgi:hypothetical protein